MGTDKQTGNRGGKKSPNGTPESVEIAGKGVKTSKDFARVMSALMGDVLSGTVDPRTANAVCNAGGKLLKMVEMQHKYGRKPSESDDRVLPLVS